MSQWACLHPCSTDPVGVADGTDLRRGQWWARVPAQPHIHRGWVTTDVLPKTGAKTIGGGRKLRYCGVARNGLWAEMALATYNLVRVAKLMPCHHRRGRFLPVEDDMPQPEVPAARSGAIQGTAYSESAFKAPQCRHRPPPHFPNSHSSSAC